MYYIKCLFGFCLVIESDESSNDVSNESYDDDEDDKYDEISIFFVPYGNVLVTSRVTLRLCRFLIFSNLLLLIHTSVHFSFFLSFL